MNFLCGNERVAIESLQVGLLYLQDLFLRLGFISILLVVGFMLMATMAFYMTYRYRLAMQALTRANRKILALDNELSYTRDVLDCYRDNL